MYTNQATNTAQGLLARLSGLVWHAKKYAKKYANKVGMMHESKGQQHIGN